MNPATFWLFAAIGDLLLYLVIGVWALIRWRKNKERMRARVRDAVARGWRGIGWSYMSLVEFKVQHTPHALRDLNKYKWDNRERTSQFL